MQETINTENMKWTDINAVNMYTANTNENKNRRSKKTPAIIWGAIQLTENLLKALRQLNVYDSASIIKSESTWIQKHSFDEFFDEQNKKVNIEVGRVYYIDYGKTYKGELSYFHYGLCVAKKEGKLFVIPITSAESYRETCYHPIKNPKASKKLRQALAEEGFSKDCVLKMNDAKFISAGRIEAMDSKINDDALLDIQTTLFSVSFPDIKRQYDKLLNETSKKDKRIEDQQKFIDKLKAENEKLKGQLSDLEKQKKSE